MSGNEITKKSAAMPKKISSAWISPVPIGGTAATRSFWRWAADSSSSPKQTSAQCPGSKKVIGGGARIYGANAQAALDESYPSSGSAWYGTAYEIVPTGVNWHLEVYAICANTGS